MDLVDDVDLALQLGRLVAHAVAQLADVVDAVVRGAVDLVVVDRGAVGDGDARRALAAGDADALLAAERLGEHARRGGLAHAARAAEEEGVVHAAACERILQRAGDVLLADDLGERLRPGLPRQHEVGHQIAARRVRMGPIA